MKLKDIILEYNLNGDFHNGQRYNNGGTDKTTVHSYIDNFYEDQFLKYKDSKVSLLEIGIQGGASLKLWKEYFLNYDTIVGIDISEDNVHSDYKNISGINYIFGDAYSDEIVNKVSSFDIIIDDGPHTIESQINCVIKYLPKLNSGGMMVTEDVQDITWDDKFVENFKKFYENDDTDDFYELETIDLRHIKGRYDDIIFVITKK